MKPGLIAMGYQSLILSDCPQDIQRMKEQLEERDQLIALAKKHIARLQASGKLFVVCD